MKTVPLWFKVMVGIVFGIILGFFIPKGYAEYIKPIGDIFIRLLKMLIIPLIFLAVVSGVGRVSNPEQLGKVGLKAVGFYFILTIIPICIAILVSETFKPGAGVCFHCTFDVKEKVVEFSSIAESIINIVPDNIFGSMSSGTFLQIVFFSLFTGGILCSMSKEKKERLVSIFDLFSSLVFRMIDSIVKLAPYGAFALITYMVSTRGGSILLGLGKLVLTAYTSFGILYILFGIMIKVFTKLSPIPFYKKSLKYQSIAFSTSSSKATLPTTMEVCRESLGVSKIGSSFILPLGASLNMSGFSISLSVAAIFIGQAAGKTFGFYDYLIIAFTSTICSIGGAGVPSGTIVMLPFVLGSVGLPIEGVAMILGIDRIMDMMSTTMNITGDALVTVLVDEREGTLDEKKYYS